jgi:hypothetical protein
MLLPVYNPLPNTLRFAGTNQDYEWPAINENDASGFVLYKWNHWLC